MKEDKDELLKPKKAAEMLHISTRTLHRWYTRGYIKAYKMPSGRLLYPVKEVKRILGIMNLRYESLRGQIWRER